jgi:hypothetical protein
MEKDQRLLDAYEQLKEQRKKIRLLSAAHIILYLVAILLLLVLQMRPAGLAVGVLTLLSQIFFLRRLNGRYSDRIGELNVLYGLCQGLEGAEYTGGTGITREQFRALAMLPLHDDPHSLLLHNAFHGKAFGLELAGCEATSLYFTPGVKNAYHHLNGTLLTATASGPTGSGDWYLLRRGLLEPAAQQAFLSAQGWREAAWEHEDQELALHYALYTREEGVQAPQTLVSRLEKLYKKAPALGAVRLSEETAAIYLADRFYTFPAKVRDLPTPDMLTRCPLSERDGAWEFFRSWAEHK